MSRLDPNETHLFRALDRQFLQLAELKSNKIHFYFMFQKWAIDDKYTPGLRTKLSLRLAPVICVRERKKQKVSAGDQSALTAEFTVSQVSILSRPQLKPSECTGFSWQREKIKG